MVKVTSQTMPLSEKTAHLKLFHQIRVQKYVLMPRIFVLNPLC